jgi:two-component sensor histidine kinase
MSVVDINELKKTEVQLQEILNEKEILLREINHRVKNNLQIIANLVNQLEENFNIKSVNGTEFKMIFKELKYKERE